MGTGRVARAQGPLRRWETDPAEHGCRDRPVTGERNRIVTAGGIKAGRDRSRPTAPLPPLQLRTRTFARHFNDIPFPDDPVGQLPSPSPQRSHLGNNCVARAAPGRREDCRPPSASPHHGPGPRPVPRSARCPHDARAMTRTTSRRLVRRAPEGVSSGPWHAPSRRLAPLAALGRLPSCAVLACVATVRRSDLSSARCGRSPGPWESAPPGGTRSTESLFPLPVRASHGRAQLPARSESRIMTSASS